MLDRRRSDPRRGLREDQAGPISPPPERRQSRVFVYRRGFESTGFLLGNAGQSGAHLGLGGRQFPAPAAYLAGQAFQPLSARSMQRAETRLATSRIGERKPYRLARLARSLASVCAMDHRGSGDGWRRCYVCAHGKNDMAVLEFPLQRIVYDYLPVRGRTGGTLLRRSPSDRRPRIAAGYAADRTTNRSRPMPCAAANVCRAPAALSSR